MKYEIVRVCSHTYSWHREHPCSEGTINVFIFNFITELKNKIKKNEILLCIINNYFSVVKQGTKQAPTTNKRCELKENC